MSSRLQVFNEPSFFHNVANLTNPIDPNPQLIRALLIGGPDGNVIHHSSLDRMRIRVITMLEMIAQHAQVDLEMLLDLAQRAKAGKRVIGHRLFERAQHTTLRITVLAKSGGQQSAIRSR
jgi:hypothetical protein